MPHIIDTVDEIIWGPNGEFVGYGESERREWYQPIEHSIQAGDLTAVTLHVLGRLEAAGYSAITAIYDGGGDDGFGRFEVGKTAGGDSHDVNTVAAALAGDPLLDADHPWRTLFKSGSIDDQLASEWRGYPPTRRMVDVLEALASVMISEAGISFVQVDRVYGRLQLDLAEGHLIDIEGNPPEDGCLD